MKASGQSRNWITRPFSKVGVTFLLLAVAVLLANCTRETAPTLVIYVRNVTPAQNKIWLDIAGEFQRHHPELQVKVLDIAYDAYWPKLFTMISSGNPPDLVLMESGYYPSFVTKGAFLDLAPLVRQSNDFSLDDYYPNSLKWLWVGEKIYGLPLDTAVMLPFFNKELFDRFGVPYPTEGWTWDDYLETAKQLTRDTNGDGRADIWGTAQPPWEAVLWAAGGDYTDDPDNPTRCTFDSPTHIEVVQWILDMREKHKVTPRETAQTAQIDPFMVGKVAMTWNGHWAVPDYEQKTAFEWDVAPLPSGKAGRGGYNFGSCFCIPARSKHPNEAWAAVRFFSGHEGLKFMAAQNILTPALRSVAESPDFLERRPPEHHHRFIDALPDGHIYPKTPHFQELRQMVNNELEKVWTGGADPAAICRRIARQGTQILNGGANE